MTVTYGFYDSLNGDRTYNAEQMSRLFEGIVTPGVFQSVGSALMVSQGTAMTVVVGSGRAWFDNTWTNNDAPMDVTLDASTVGLNRIDAIVLEVNKDLGVRANAIKAVKGTPATNPVPPTMANTATLKQYALAHIYVGSSVTAITNANITNKVGSAETPYITGIIDTISVGELMAQYEAQFNDWFAELQNELDSNQAANLLNLIQQEEADRIADVDAEETARIADVDAEETARIAAVSAEATARTNADNTLSGRITALETAPQASGDWTQFTGPWTYSAAQTITVPGPEVAQLTIGNKVKLVQGGITKYYSIVGISGTTVTLWSGAENPLLNTTITDRYISRAETPSGFPNRFVMASTYVAGVTMGNAVYGAYGYVSGNTFHGEARFQFPSATPTCAITGQITFGLPAPISPNTPGYTVLGSGGLVDSGSALYMGAIIYNAGGLELRVINTGGSYATWAYTSATVPFTWGVNDFFTLKFAYTIA